MKNSKLKKALKSQAEEMEIKASIAESKVRIQNALSQIDETYFDNMKDSEDEDESELDKVALGISDDIENKFKEYCSDSLLQNIEDWYNNEGGYGHIIFKLADNSYTIENNCYRQEVDTFNHEGTLSLEM